MRRALAVFAGLALAACQRPSVPALAVPAAPVLDAVDGVQHRRLFSLRGVAATEVTVRLFADSACAGPVYLQGTGAELQQGLRVVLIAGVDNYFSANAVSVLGATSACSAPLQLTYVSALRPVRPSVSVQPVSPSQERVFTVSGITDPMTRVQLHESSCLTPVVAELSADGFSTGFTVEVAPNASFTVALDAVNEDSTSDCVTWVLINDTLPPRTSVMLASPSPSPQLSAYVVLGGEIERTWLFGSLDCGGVMLAWGARDSMLTPSFPAGAATAFSVLSADLADNMVCVPGDRLWENDPSLPEEEAVVLIPQAPVFGSLTVPFMQVPMGRLRLQVFLSEDCSGQPLFESSAFPAAIEGLYLHQPLDAGFLTARTTRMDGGVDPCSNAVPWQP